MIAVEGKTKAHKIAQELATRIESARVERDRLFEATRWRIERHAEEIALGIPVTEELTPVLLYREALRRITTDPAFPDMDWPIIPYVLEGLCSSKS